MSMNRTSTAIYAFVFDKSDGFEERVNAALQPYQARQKRMRISPIHGHVLIRKSFVEATGITVLRNLSQ